MTNYDLGEDVPQASQYDLGEGNVAPAEKIEPGFLKKLEMINTGVHRGVTHFTHAVLSKLPFGERYQKAIKDADADIEAAQEYNKKTYSGYYPQGGELGGEMLATLPVGGVLGKVAQGAEALGGLAPTGLKTLAKYGTSALGGAGVLAGMESQRYNPEAPGEMFNKDAAKDALESPLSYAIPMLGTKLSTWAGASRALGEAKEIVPDIMARQIKPDSASKSVADQFFGLFPNLTHTGKQINQLKHIGDTISTYVNKIAGRPEAMNSEDLINYAGKQIKGTLNVTKLQNDLLWDKPFKQAIVNTPQDVKDEVVRALDIIKDVKSAVPRASLAETLLKKGIRKDKLSVENVKNIQTVLGNTIHEINSGGKGGGLGKEISDELSEIRENLFTPIQNSLSGEDFKDFTTAKQHSAMFYELKNSSPLIKKAIRDEVESRNLIRAIIGTPKSADKNKAAFNIMGDSGQTATVAAKMAQIMEASNTEGKFNLSEFLTQTGNPQVFPNVLKETDAYKSLEGLNKYLSAINEGSKTGWWRQMAVGAGITAATGAGAVGAGALGAAVPLLSYATASFVANHSPLKTLLHAATKNLPSSTYEQVTKAIEKQLTKAGFIVSNGALQHKDEE